MPSSECRQSTRGRSSGSFRTVGGETVVALDFFWLRSAGTQVLLFSNFFFYGLVMNSERMYGDFGVSKDDKPVMVPPPAAGASLPHRTWCRWG